jgi:hypothetical protein
LNIEQNSFKRIKIKPLRNEDRQEEAVFPNFPQTGGVLMSARNKDTGYTASKEYRAASLLAYSTVVYINRCAKAAAEAFPSNFFLESHLEGNPLTD